jgi:hypothetical protein
MNCFAQQSDKNRGYQSYIDFGAQINLEGYQSTVMGVDYIGGYRGGEHFFIGLGIGARYAVESSYSDVTNSVGSNNFYISHHEIEQSVALPTPQLRLPAFLHMRAYISDRRCQPFFAPEQGGNRAVTGKGTFRHIGGFPGEQLHVQLLYGIQLAVAVQVELHWSASFM